MQKAYLLHYYIRRLIYVAIGMLLTSEDAASKQIVVIISLNYLSSIYVVSAKA